MALDIISKPGLQLESPGLRSQQLRPQGVEPASGAQPAGELSAAQGVQKAPEKQAAAQSLPPMDKAAVSSAVDDLNQAVQNVRRELEFSVDEESGKTIVKVVDSKTGDVIRQLPPDEVLAMSRHLKEYVDSLDQGKDAKGRPSEAVGLIVRTQA